MRRNEKYVLVLMAVVSFFLFYRIVLFSNRTQGELLKISQSILSVEPPLVGPWVYLETWIFLGAYTAFFVLIFLFCVIAKRFFGIDSISKSAALFFVTALLAVEVQEWKGSNWRIKPTLYVLFCLSILYTILFRFGKIKEYKELLIKSIEEKYSLYLGFILLFSTLQRVVALYLDPNLLMEGDDPAYYYSAALQLYEHGVHPHSGFSSGMIYFLAASFRLFGSGQVVAKLLLILVGGVGLGCFALFAADFFRSKTISVFAAGFYLISSHYVSFSNQFWNENLFHPILSVFLFCSFRFVRSLSTGYFLSFVFYSIAVGSTFFFLIQLRSWFLLTGACFLLLLWFFESYELKKRPVLFVSGVAILTIVLIGCGFAFREYQSKEGNFLLPTSNGKSNFIIGNHPYSQGTYTRHWVTYSKEVALDLNSDELLEKVIFENLNQPLVLVSNLGKKTLLWFFSAGGPRPFTNYYQHPLSFAQYFFRISCFLLMGWGFFYSYKYRLGKILPAVYVSIFAVHLIYFADYRFTLTAMPLQAVFIAHGLLALTKTAFEGNVRNKTFESDSSF
ncbi:dolichyl-phosphate-mannose-protein mannosyltransferase [Leptospira gomenensis]|uniref:Dolichyl-phosphate-mannose-protein mannosyltransferase n=1 Tax=Leptospira gomenensis TaxID=2484974 RepID=A0A5F1YTT9_9LEPT|nr:glycosyltransferase family 39 protein [Leptospira gomenensis]TGK30882.1 dolichyl-phosphate-mannose-protein mannosyltransferase [Leptospira gomenensis]TGK32520.1 dolichyl-phosphate-mannose-protein mannosyltransferase [Leptospira gomenensis]TGK45398.1 dolichyl-phosphate-mannose-protein mannosyltransferase [Leptospira gomenensis]TGK60610.1 dolichyl-phosphate-mannose-protein mannosyltransferase [Leptospira gomenensis]